MYAPEPEKAHAKSLLLDARVGGEPLAHSVENRPHLRRRRLVAEAERGVDEELVAPAPVLDLGRDERAVRDRDDRAVEKAHARGVERDVLDRADGRPDADGVADAHDPVAEDDEAAEEVLEALLRRESERHAADAEAGESGREVDAEARERAEHGRGDHGSPEQQARDRERRRRARALGEEPQRRPPVHEVDEAEEEPRDPEDDDEPRELRVVVAAEKGKGEARDAGAMERHREEESHGTAESGGAPKELGSPRVRREEPLEEREDPAHEKAARRVEKGNEEKETRGAARDGTFPPASSGRRGCGFRPRAT